MADEKFGGVPVKDNKKPTMPGDKTKILFAERPIDVEVMGLRPYDLLQYGLNEPAAIWQLTAPMYFTKNSDIMFIYRWPIFTIVLRSYIHQSPIFKHQLGWLNNCYRGDDGMYYARENLPLLHSIEVPWKPAPRIYRPVLPKEAKALNPKNWQKPYPWQQGIDYSEPTYHCPKCLVDYNLPQREPLDQRRACPACGDNLIYIFLMQRFDEWPRDPGLNHLFKEHPRSAPTQKTADPAPKKQGKKKAKVNWWERVPE